MVVKELKNKTKISVVLDEINIAKSTFYYRPTSTKQGRQPPGFTLKADGIRVSDGDIKSEIEKLLSQEFVNYGYVKVTHYLKQLGYVINKKKVYRLMKEERLLLRKRIKTSGTRNFIKSKVVKPNSPYQFLQMDIKYFWLREERRNAYLLSILDVFSRKVLGFTLGRSIRKKDVVSLLKRTLALFKQAEGITLRNDNGSQFLAHMVREYLKERGIYQEFTHVAHPEENGHIEALHSILEQEVEKRFEFNTFDDLEKTLKRYFKFYNKERIHSSIGYKSPDRFLHDFYAQESVENLEKEMMNDLDLMVKI